DPQAALEKYGIDSILAMKLTSQLEHTFGSLSKTLFFEYQTIRELTDYFTQSHSAQLTQLFATTSNNHDAIKLAETQPKTQTQLEAKLDTARRFSRRRHTVQSPAKEAEAIAIVGLSGRYPGAINVAAYWNNLREGKDCITEVPRERWDWREYF